VFDESRWQTVNGEIVPSTGAIDNVQSMKGQALMSSKAETINDISGTVSYLAGAGKARGDLNAEEISWRQQIAQGYANSYDDAGSREAWLNIGRRIGMSDDEMSYVGRGSTDPAAHDMLTKPKDAGGGGAGPQVLASLQGHQLFNLYT
jgi:hypothetical protein